MLRDVCLEAMFVLSFLPYFSKEEDLDLLEAIRRSLQEPQPKEVFDSIFETDTCVTFCVVMGNGHICVVFW